MPRAAWSRRLLGGALLLGGAAIAIGGLVMLTQDLIWAEEATNIERLAAGILAVLIGLVVMGAGVVVVARVGMPLAVVIAIVLAVYLVFKYVRQHRFLRHLPKARITAMELKRRLEAGDHLRCLT